MKEKKYHYIYITTNLSTYEFYVGLHSSHKHPDDDIYLGSGKRLLRQVNKYGRSNFHRRIVREFATRVELVAAEADHITTEFLKLPGVLNLTTGGQTKKKFAGTGWTMPEEARQKISKSRMGMKFSDEHRAKISAYQKGKKQPRDMVEKRAAKLRGRPSPKVSIANKGRQITWDCNSKKSIETRRARGTDIISIFKCQTTKALKYQKASPWPKLLEDKPA